MRRLLVFLVLSCGVMLTAEAKIILITAINSYTDIEAARAGDQVVIAPGTYSYRVYLAAQAPATNPIVIRAQDPFNPPVWDFGTNLIDNTSGSYTAPDRARGAWQFSGASGYQVSGIVFANCHNAAKNCGAIRYYSASTNIYIKDCVFRNNDNGITGGTSDSQMTVEFCEFYNNGNTAATSPTHNLYIYGGDFTMRYCYVHDSVQGQNFHIRARNSTLEYNWFARANSYEGDLMTDDDFANPGTFSQSMLVRGNIFLQKTNPANNSQELVLFNDGGVTNLTMSVRVIANTFVGNGNNTAFIHLSNADGTQMNAEIDNNIIFGTKRPYLIENTTNATLVGKNNWLSNTVNPGVLTGSVSAATPGFRDSTAMDFTLLTNSACIGTAATNIIGLPGLEYFRNEATNRMYRIRCAARDIGAFESTTSGAAFGPYDPAPPPVVNASPSANQNTFSWPLFGADYVLEQTTNLRFPTSWTIVPPPYTTNAGGISVNVSNSGSANFFRLRKP